MHMEFKHNIYGDNDFEPIDVYHEIVIYKIKHLTRKFVNKNICNENLKLYGCLLKKN